MLIGGDRWGWSSLWILGVCVLIKSQALSQPLGVDVCGRCHPKQLAAWKRGPHAKSYRVLALHQRRDPHCRTCHDEAGLSEVLRLSFELKRTRQVNDRGVGCESCHGLGGDILDQKKQHKRTHQNDAVKSQVSLPLITAQTCDRCHRLEPIVQPPSYYPPFSLRNPFTHGQYDQVKSEGK